jgi:hypothetical protein
MLVAAVRVEGRVAAEGVGQGAGQGAGQGVGQGLSIWNMDVQGTASLSAEFEEDRCG